MRDVRKGERETEIERERDRHRTGDTIERNKKGRGIQNERGGRDPVPRGRCEHLLPGHPAGLPATRRPFPRVVELDGEIRRRPTRRLLGQASIRSPGMCGSVVLVSVCACVRKGGRKDRA
ncbi:Protein of unknown function [Gryllus bimaculatus]|nr:Protein of unknown function [Gryllus bimaculatus]